MTKIVVFGNLTWFESKDGGSRNGNDGDVIYLVEDRDYALNAKFYIPKGDLSSIPVFLHRGSSQLHANQLAGLKAAGYELGSQNEFSHDGDESRRIKTLLHDGTADQVSAFIGEYTGRMVLDWEDRLASWATLKLISTLNQLPFDWDSELRALRFKVAGTPKWATKDNSIRTAPPSELLRLLESGPAA
jgi:hypothetical protein